MLNPLSRNQERQNSNNILPTHERTRKRKYFNE